jgi:uncharacterized protein with PIN domain
LQGFSAGSNGFQGFSPNTAGITRRRSHGAYLDLEGNPTDTLLVAAAVRGEKFSDFGQAFTAAALNFGDCCSYALARATGEPLLFKGIDFANTDIATVSY